MLNQQQNQHMIPSQIQDSSQPRNYSVSHSFRLSTDKITQNNEAIISQNNSILKLLNVLLIGIIIVLLVQMVFSDKLNSLQAKVNQINIGKQQKTDQIQTFQRDKPHKQQVAGKIQISDKGSTVENIYQSDIKIEVKSDGQVKKQYKIQKRAVYNPQNQGKRFAKLPQFVFNITELIPDIQSFQHSMRQDETKDNESTVFVLEPKDFDKLYNKIDFQKLQKDLTDSISHQVLQFEEDKKLERKRKYISYKKLRTTEKLQEFIDKIQTNNPGDKEEAFKIAYSLYIEENRQEIFEAEYYHANKRYNISKNEEQIPICIISTGRNLFSRRQYSKFFYSLENINYTNFHIVYVDDFSQDNSAYQIYNFVGQNNFTLKNNLKIIHNLQNLGCLANVFFWVKRYCNQDDIVVNIDADDAILLPQAFQILNSIYSNPNKWFVYSKFVVTNSYQKNPMTPLRRADTSLPLNTTVENYRRSGWFMTSHLRTYRMKLMKAVPIYEFMEYHFDRKTGLAYPTFPFFTSDVYQVYSLLELAGEDRIEFLGEYLYLYFYGTSFQTRNCYRFHELHDNLKASLKPRLYRLKSLEQKGKRIENDNSILQYNYNKLQTENNQAMVEKCYLPFGKN